MERSFLSRGLLAASGAALSAVLLFAPFASALAFDPPTSKHLQPGVPGMPVTIGENLPDRIDAAYQNIRWEMIGTGTMAFMNAMQTFFGQLAYDAADYLATGGEGQSALFYEKGFEGYLKDVGGAAAGEFIGSMTQSSFFRTIGFDLCRPDPKALLRIQLSLGGFLNSTSPTFQRPQAKCDFNDVINNYEEVYQTLSNENILKNVDASLNTTSNDLGVSFLIFNRAQNFVYNRQSNAEKDRKEGNGYQSLRDIVSGRVRTPSDTIREEANQVLVKDPKANQAQVNSFILNQAWELGPIRLATYTASVFLNTFASKMLSRVFEDGIGIFDRVNIADIDTTRGADDLLLGNAQDARQANIDLRTPNLFQDRAYNVLADMQACPQSRGTWNCAVDEGLAQALNSGTEAGSYTVREALDRGYLKKSWRLYPSSNVREEKDPLCYTYGYCAGNLRKLRLMRIIPVGFEFAANDPKNLERCAGDQGCITLGEVVSGFTNCNAQGKKDADHPWCKLIDPNWAITSFPQQCALTGFGDAMLSSGLPQRREECQDIQTCLRRNDQGACIGGYGQCVTEKAVYRFGGQECSARYASCRTYTARNTSAPVSLLRNTLDYAQCSSDNAGCLWYSTERDPADPRANAWLGTATTGPRVYLDKTLEACAADGEGCTKLLAVAEGEKALNLIANSSFERIELNGTLSDWLPVSGDNRGFVRPNVTVGNRAADGAVAASIAGGFEEGYRQIVDIQPGKNYVISGFVRRERADSGEPVATIAVRQYPSRANALANTNALTPAAIARDYRTRDCSLVSSTDGAIGATVPDAVTNSDEWSRVECQFTANAATRAGSVLLDGKSVLIDAVMLEEGELAGRYIDGANAALETVYHKVAPDEFACKGDATDPAACGNYAQACRQTEAGCQGYTDTNGTFPEVAAQLSNNDLCPASCVGYAEYRKLASAFDLVQSATPELNDASERRSETFIPSTAQQCTQDAVGCEAFTVVDGAIEGGENQAYFKSLRFCERPADDTATYFTWEGSDSAGYQLRTWSLKKRTDAKPGDLPPAPETSVIVAAAAGPRIVVKRSGELFETKNPQDCNEANWRTGADQDCRQFYDAGGNVFYRYYTQTVLSTNDCRTYRLNDRSEDDCRKTGGTFQAEQRSCLYQAYAPESGTCSENFAGCRAYAGAEAGNIRTIFTANGTDATAMTGATVSSESLLVGDQSFRTNVPAGGSASAAATFQTVGNGLYRVSFWAKASASSTMVVRAASTRVGDVGGVVGTARLTTEWQQLTFGLFEGAAGDQTRLLWTSSAAAAAPAAVFLDEINVQQLRDVVFVRRASWETPVQCDQNAYGVPEPQAMLGCREYRSRDGQTVQARQFSQLCRPQAIGCREFINTRNNENPYRTTFTLSDLAASSITERPAASYIYLIDDVTRRCDASNASCRAFGLPVMSADRRTVASYTTVYLKDDITKYGDALCKPSELYCEEFATSNGNEYFKNPQNHLCEYRDQVALTDEPGIENGTYSGWFVKGENRPCYPNALASGQLFQVLRTGDTLPEPGYEGWGATCPAEQGECTEFRDTNDKTATEPTGRSYYFINNDQIDTRSCNGSVDPSRGCVLLRNMSKATLTYSTDATLQAYQANNLKPVNATDCQTNPSAPGCNVARTGRCIGSKVTTRFSVRGSGNGTQIVEDGTSTGPYSGGACSQASDCAPEAATRPSGRTLSATNNFTGVTTRRSEFEIRAENVTCERPSANDANEIVKVRLDRDCAQWLGCATGETVYDPATNQYRDTCTKVALCDRGSEQAGGASYCSNYVNRATTSTEPVLAAGAYFDATTYTSRPAQVNARDYSGYSIPNAFQAVDLQSRALSTDAGVPANGRAAEQRLVVAVKMPPIDQSTLSNASGLFRHSVPPIRLNQAEVIPRSDVAAYEGVVAGVALCRHRGTGIVGYFNRDEAQRAGQEVNCYLSFHGQAEAGEFAALNERLRLGGSDQDLALDQAYPRALCRAYPESDAPFSAEVVGAWDLTMNPARASSLKSGYESANYCAYGENCSCSYKRVTYPGQMKPLFFATESQAVPPGVCVGGPRDGQSCLPSEVFNISSSTSTSAQVAQASNNAQTCGPTGSGGSCVAFSKAEIVRGVMGSCLEYDTTHGKGKIGQETFPCLVWNPSPIVGGQGDSYHYVQTAGYFPPQNSGQYYCTSEARAPVSYALTAESFSSRNLPGGIDQRAFSYDDKYVSDANEVGTGGNEVGAYFGRARPSGSQAAAQCEDADDRQDDDGAFEKDYRALRLVATGRGDQANYTEAFYPINPTDFARSKFSLYYGAVPTTQQRQTATDEKNIGYIEIKPFRNPNGNGRLACGYQEDWVDGIQVDDYDDVTKVADADRQWQQSFYAEQDLQTNLTRGSEKVLTQARAGQGSDKPLRMPCEFLADTTAGAREADPASPSAQCYFKTWEIGYRATGNKTFEAFDANQNTSGRTNARDGFGALSGPIMQQCESDKPYYAIRAVFQTEASNQSVADTLIKPRDIRGPWRIIGFWVTACGGKAQADNRFIYMNINVQTADVCRDLAEVRSVETGQDAAFTDRVWRQSKYAVPILGIQYGQSFAPFSSALNTGPAGEQPLYQTGGRLAGSSSVNPPTFLASGFKTYYGPATTGAPRDRYAYLSNLFARIYRVYKYNEQPISEDDRVCQAGPLAGRRCVPDALTTTNASGDCRPPSGAAACDTSVVAQPSVEHRVCNALSGINAGLSCGTNQSFCHLYAVDPRTSARASRPLLTSCRMVNGWTKVAGTDGEEMFKLGTAAPVTRHVAQMQGVFRCAPGAVRLRGEIGGHIEPENDGDRDPDLRYAYVGGDAQARLIQPISGQSQGFRLSQLDVLPEPLAEDPGTVYCSTEQDISEECPLEVVGSCVKPAGAPVKSLGTCRVNWGGPDAQSNVNTAVSCYMDSDCSFSAANFWRHGGVSAPNSSRLADGRFSFVVSPRAIGAYDSHDNFCDSSYEMCIMNGAAVTSKIFVAGTGPDEMQEVLRFPGSSVLGGYAFNKPVLDGDEDLIGHVNAYVIGGCDQVVTNPAASTDVYVNRYGLTDRTQQRLLTGTCMEGSAQAGNLCVKPALGAESTFPYASWSQALSCDRGAVVSTAPGINTDTCLPISRKVCSDPDVPVDRCTGTNLVIQTTPTDRCRTADSLANESAERYWNRKSIASDLRNLNTDNNTCTSEVGYQVNRTICPNPSDEFCGLISYDMRQTATGAPQSPDSLNKGSAFPLPTDVTLGLYTPSFLGLPTEGTGSNVVAESNYEYIDYYTPRPPRIASPASSCPPGSSCGAQNLDRFTFNGITQGIVNVIGGQYRSTIRFFGWAAHEQMAIRHLSVDWGDGAVQDLDDVKLKNHKPYCSVNKECYSPSDGFTGLTCETNNDCPLEAQACRSMGSCNNKQNLVCSQDSDCRREGGQDTCNIRAFFGNSAEACEASPFEFSHVYACPATAATSLPRCEGQNFVAGSVLTAPVPAGVVAPAGGRPGTCYYGAALDGSVIDLIGRTSCTVATDCLANYARLINVADASTISPVIREAITCGPPIPVGATAVPSSSGAPIPATQARCSGDTTRFCSTNADCAAGDRCLSAGIAPPNGCWDDQNNACRFTPRVFLQDNWGWCTGECRAQNVGGTLQDSASSYVKHAYGGCYSPVSPGGDPTSATRTNTQNGNVESELTGEARFGYRGLECAIDRPNGAIPATPADARRNFRPWIVFPGSIQLRPTNR